MNAILLLCSSNVWMDAILLLCLCMCAGACAPESSSVTTYQVFFQWLPQSFMASYTSYRLRGNFCQYMLLAKSFQRIFLHSENFWHIQAIVSARAYAHSNAWAPPTTSWKVTCVIREINLVKFLSQYIVWTFSENLAMYGISWILMQLYKIVASTIGEVYVTLPFSITLLPIHYLISCDCLHNSWNTCTYTVEPRLADTPDMWTSRIMRTLCSVRNAISLDLHTNRPPEIQTPCYSVKRTLGLAPSV